MLKVVLQDGIKDCGVCCLLSIIRFYGGEISKEMLRKLTNTNKDGVTAYNLIEAAKSLGMDAYGVTGQINKININNLPCIAHIRLHSNYQHFVVIYKIDKKYIVIMDPAKGKRNLTHSEFKLLTTNHYIFLKAKKKLPFIKQKRIIKKLLINHFTQNRISFSLLTSLMFLLLILSLVLSFHFKYILTFSINYFTDNNIYLICIISFTISTFYIILSFLYNKLLFKIVFMFDSELTFKTFKQLLLLPYFYYKNRTTGEILSRFHDLATMKNFLFSAISYFISDLISILLFLIILFNQSMELTLCLIIYIFFVLLYILLRSKKKKNHLKDVKYLEDSMNSYIVEAISNVDTTKGSHLEKRFTDKYFLKYRQFLEKNYQYVSYGLIDSLFLQFLCYVLLIVVYGIGGYLVIQNKLTLSTFIIFQTFFQVILKSYHRILGILEEVPNYLVCLHRIEDLYTIVEEDFSKSYYFLTYRLQGKIEFQNLEYSINHKVLFHNVSFSIESGDRVLLYGSSGSGKSTLVKMLLRYVEVPYGMIQINQIDINHYHLENIRKYITYVTANELLFSDSIYNNICLYQEISDEDFLKVIHITKVNQIFGENIDDYKKILEENGFLLSSGERQRLILARALLRDSDIFIFDESFGQIDIELTNKILKDMFLYLKDKTIIVISHRQNTKKLFNRIFTIMDGCIYEKEKL